MVELSGQGRFQIADGGGVQFFGLESQAPAQLQMRTFADQGGGGVEHLDDRPLAQQVPVWAGIQQGRVVLVDAMG